MEKKFHSACRAIFFFHYLLKVTRDTVKDKLTNIVFSLHEKEITSILIKSIVPQCNSKKGRRRRYEPIPILMDYITGTYQCIILHRHFIKVKKLLNSPLQGSYLKFSTKVFTLLYEFHVLVASVFHNEFFKHGSKKRYQLMIAQEQHPF